MNPLTRRRFHSLLSAGAVVMTPSSYFENASQPMEKGDMWEQALEYSFDRVSRNLAQLTGFPEFTQGDHWHCVEHGGWVGGHWVGLLWLAYVHTGNIGFERAARKWAARLSRRQEHNTTHDLGFLFELSHVLGAQITGDATFKSPALAAAKTLACRFNGRGKFFPAWDTQPGRAIIDTMMNMNLLFWATRETGHQLYAQEATDHAHTAINRLVRHDWSTAHVADFDPQTGVFLGQGTHQGLSPTSCWSRGQSWAVYGFATCYRATGEDSFLSAARNLAEYALRRLPADHVPYWDYDSPLIPDDVRDSSAAAILAAALLRLSGAEPDQDRARRWREGATAILGSLWQNYSSRDLPEPSILVHGTCNKPSGSMDHGLIYGDYYFVEALEQAIGNLQ